jgi:hypothetical protein
VLVVRSGGTHFLFRPGASTSLMSLGTPDRSNPSIGKGFELGPCLADGAEECSEGLACFGDQRLLRFVLAMLIAIDAKHKKSDS